MGYRKIQNLYKDITILDVFKEVYALEKVHGTSAHVGYRKDLKTGNDKLIFFSGGVKHDPFVALFDHDVLLDKFRDMGHPSVTVYGEAYGGSCQRMGNVYGKELRFIGFEVLVGESWLQVEKAANVVERLGLEFVHWVRGPATEEFVNKWRDAPSELAQRRGMGDNHTREGVVIRPVIEVRLNNGERMMAKHKHPDFRETATPREIDPEKQKRYEAAQTVAEEFVVPMRLEHVLDKFVADGFEVEMKHTKKIIDRMVADVKVEEGDAIAWSKEVEKAIGKQTVKLLKQHLNQLTK